MTRTQLYARSLLVCMTMLLSYLGFAQNQNPPMLVKDINAGTTGSNPNTFVALGNKTIFIANDGGGKKLFQTDGTTNGTTPIAAYSGNLIPVGTVALNNQVYFATSKNTGVLGETLFLLYRTNGATTVLVDTLFNNISPTVASTYAIKSLFAQSNQLYYHFEITSFRLTTTELTAHNLQRKGSKTIGVINSNTSTTAGSAFAASLVFFGTNTFYLFTQTSSSGSPTLGEIVSVIRNTSPTSSRVLQTTSWLNFNPPPAGYQFTPLGAIGDNFYAINKDTLVRFDSTGVRTALKVGVGTGIIGGSQKVGTLLYFRNGANQLWRTDGTAAGTVQISSANLPPNTILGNLVTDGTELYVQTTTLSVFPAYRRVVGNAITNAGIGQGTESGFSNVFFANGNIYGIMSPNTPCIQTLLAYNPTTNTNTSFPLVTPADCTQAVVIDNSYVVLPNNLMLFSFFTTPIGGELWKLDLNPPVVPLPDFSIRISNLRVNTSQVGTPRDPYSTPTSLDYVITASNLDLTDTRPLNVRAYVSNDSIFSADDAPLVFQSLSQRDLPFNLITNGFPVLLRTAGLKYIFLKVDSENGVVEANENNNVSNPLAVNAYAVSCASNGVSPYNEWVSNVQFNTINNTSEKTRYGNIFGFQVGYSNFLDVSTTVNKGQTYPLSITPSLGYPTYPTNLFTRVWIDYNQNGIFEDAEIVLAKNGNQIATQNITVPSTALVGTTAMRVSMKAGAYPTACEVFEKGEVEDYTITIQAGTDPCLTDVTPPVFSNCPTNKLITGASLGCTPISWRVPTATDNCSTPSVSFVLKRGSTILNQTDTVVFVQLCPNNYTDTVVYTARDARGNVATCQFEIKAIDRCIADRRDEGSLPTDQNLTTTNGNCVNFKWAVPVRFFPCPRFYSYEPWALPTTSPSVTIGRADLRIVNNAPSGSVVLDSACFPIGTTLVNYVDLNGVAKTFKVTVTRANTNSCRNQDSLQLVSLYNATNGANWINKWNLATPINTWNGVTLNANGCVEGIVLLGNNLTGTLPNLSLTSLKFINVSGNKLTGAIPNFNNLPILEELVLTNNLLTGAIPNFNLPKLKFLILYTNQLSGTIPNLNLQNMVTFDAHQNKLTGAIPNFNLSKIINLVLDNNLLTGLPNFATMPLLENLDLNTNQLTGSIPSISLPALKSLNLAINQLTGVIPNFNLPKLTGLILDKNQLSGTIPNLSLPSAGNISLSNNKLTGSIPLFTAPNIVSINLSNNLLSGCLPVYLVAYCGKLVDISGNPALFNQNFATFCANDVGSCNAPLPDFRMTAITQTLGSDLTTTTYRPGIDGFGVNYTVVNNGGNYVSPVTAFFYLSKDTILDSRDSFFTKLLAGATGTFLAGGPVPNLPDGDYFLIGKANGDNAIPETNPNNNVFVLKTPTVKIRSGNVTDMAIFLSTNKGFYQPYSPLTYRINLENRGSVPFSNVKIEFKFPANTVSGGAAVPNIGTWQEWCAGGVQCFTWTIPTWPLTAPTPTLDIPLYVLNTNAPIVATAKLLSSTPVDANTVNNSATYTITQAPAAPTTQALAFQVPTQLIPVIIQAISPNPTESDIVVKLDSWTKQDVDFNFSDITGKTILSEKRTLDKGMNRVAFDVSYLPQGVYFIQTNVGKGRNVPTKFVKM